MPVCNRCQKMQPSVEVRRSPKRGFFCKDKILCDVRTGKLIPRPRKVKGERPEHPQG